MKVVVCGGRDFVNKLRLFKELDQLNDEQPFTELWSGNAPGADRLAEEWAELNGVPVRRFHAAWDVYGSEAGIIRNRVMADAMPDLVVAFPGETGTLDMIRKSRARNIRVIETF